MFAQVNLSHGVGSGRFHYRQASSDEKVIQQVFVNQEYSLARLPLHPKITGLLESKLARGLRPLIIDLGANIGASATYFSVNFPTCRVVAVEPDSGNFDLLVRNTQEFDCPAVRGVAASEKGRARTYDPGLGHWGMRTELQTDGPMETFTVPELLETHGGDGFFPFIAKIDIEGGESELFSKDTDWIDLFPVLIIELHDWLLPGANSSRNFLQCVARRERDFVYFGEHVFSIKTPVG